MSHGVATTPLAWVQQDETGQIEQGPLRVTATGPSTAEDESCFLILSTPWEASFPRAFHPTVILAESQIRHGYFLWSSRQIKEMFPVSCVSSLGLP